MNSQLVTTLADDIAKARTLAELRAVRSRLKTSTKIGDDDRMALSLAVINQERHIIQFYQLHDHAKTQS